MNTSTGISNDHTIKWFAIDFETGEEMFYNAFTWSQPIWHPKYIGGYKIEKSYSYILYKYKPSFINRWFYEWNHGAKWVDFHNGNLDNSYFG
jgi:hypothetical protein